MKTKAYDAKYQIMAEINMVPLIDVALVLLIIFMIMTPILVASQIKVSLPGAASSTASSDKALDIVVNKKGDILVNGRGVAKADLQKEIRLALREAQTKSVTISADKDAAFDHVVAVMDAARLVGVQKMSVAVHKVRGR